MSTKTIIGLQSHITGASQQACAADSRWTLPLDTARCKFLGLRYIALDQIVEKDEGKSRFTLLDILYTLWDIFFPDRGRETYRELEGEDMTLIVAYKSGRRYLIPDGNTRLAAARYVGNPYILAEVWELP